MGNKQSSMPPETLITLVGAEDVGKTTLLFGLDSGDICTTIPTTKTSDTVVQPPKKIKGLHYVPDYCPICQLNGANHAKPKCLQGATLVDVGGDNDTFNFHFGHLKEKSTAYFFLVSSVREHFDQHKDQHIRLLSLLKETNRPVLVICTKTDIGEYTIDEIKDMLDLKEGDLLFVTKSEFMKFELKEGIAWLCSKLAPKK